MDKNTSKNLQNSSLRKRVRLLSVGNADNYEKMATSSMQNNCKRRRLQRQPCTNKNLTVESEDTKSSNVKERSLSLTSLNDDVMLHMFSYLNWMDSINLAATCDRFPKLKYVWADKKDQKFILDDYMNMVENVPKTMLSSIAPHIRILETSAHNQQIMKLCRNIKSLKLNYRIGRSAARKINSWIKASNVNCFSFSVCDDIDALLDGVTRLQELEINYFHRNTEQIIGRNTNLERLSVELDTNYNFGTFQKLQSLQALHLRSSDIAHLGKIEKYENLENLTEFSFQNDAFSDEQHILYTFIEHLAQKSRLDKLQLVNCFIDGNIFDALKSLNLSTLSLCCDFSAQDLIDFVLANPLPHLKHLKMSTCSSEQLLMLIEEWTSLETICLYVDDDDMNDILNGSFSEKIVETLGTFQTRPPLSLHLVARGDSEHRVNIEITINLVQQQVKVMKDKDDFCCSITKSFNFSSKECFLFQF